MKQSFEEKSEDMNYIEFKTIIDSIKKDKPVLFQLSKDKTVLDETVDKSEEYYGIKFPDSYRVFLKELGGGYLGFLLIFSLDKDGMFYLQDHISVDFVDEAGMLPVIDLETGDYIGYKIEDGICKEKMVIWLHEEREIRDLKKGFYEIVLERGFKISN